MTVAPIQAHVLRADRGVETILYTCAPDVFPIVEATHRVLASKQTEGFRLRVFEEMLSTHLPERISRGDGSAIVRSTSLSDPSWAWIRYAVQRMDNRTLKKDEVVRVIQDRAFGPEPVIRLLNAGYEFSTRGMNADLITMLMSYRELAPDIFGSFLLGEMERAARAQRVGCTMLEASSLLAERACRVKWSVLAYEMGDEESAIRETAFDLPKEFLLTLAAGTKPGDERSTWKTTGGGLLAETKDRKLVGLRLLTRDEVGAFLMRSCRLEHFVFDSGITFADDWSCFAKVGFRFS